MDLPRLSWDMWVYPGHKIKAGQSDEIWEDLDRSCGAKIILGNPNKILPGLSQESLGRLCVPSLVSSDVKFPSSVQSGIGAHVPFCGAISGFASSMGPQSKFWNLQLLRKPFFRFSDLHQLPLKIYLTLKSAIILQV